MCQAQVFTERTEDTVRRISLEEARAKIRALRTRLRPVHDDEGARAAYREGSVAEKLEGEAELKEMLARSTGSINNSYLKVQIASGLIIGLIALFLTVFGQLKNVDRDLLVAGVILDALGIAASFLVTTPKKTTFLEVVTTPGIHVMTQSGEDKFVALSKRAFHNRVMLLRNRRVSWIATWVLTLPGFVLAMMSWAPGATALALVAAGGAYLIWRWLFGPLKPTASLKFPMH